MLLKRQQCSSVSIINGKKRKSISYHINKRQLHRNSLKITTDFNSQLLSNENSQDFANLVGSYKNIHAREEPPKTEVNGSLPYKNVEAPLLLVSRYPTIKNYDSPKDKKIQRHLTEPVYSLGPSQFRLESLPKQAIRIQNGQPFQRYRSPSSEDKPKLFPMFPNLQLKIRNEEKLSGTCNPNTTEIIKPWETRRDFFHETFKCYIAEKSRGGRWLTSEKLIIN